MSDQAHEVVIIGGGFGGLRAASYLKNASVRVTLLDRRNFHLFQPLLYQVATGALSPANIAAPIRALLKRHTNTRVLLAEVVDVDVAKRRVVLGDGTTVSYDTLVLAAGADNHYFGHDGWQRVAPALKSIEDATGIRARILRAFESAERETDVERRRAWLTFVVVGGGPTGVELAGQLGELAHATLKREYRNYSPMDARILLLEGADRVLTAFPPELSAKALAALQRLGVEVRANTKVTDIQARSVSFQHGDQVETLQTRTVLWAAGVRGSPLGRKLAEAAGIEVDRGGRVLVQPDLTVPGYPELFVIGDLAHFTHQTGQPLPGVAPVAMQQGYYVASLIQERLRGRTLPPFHYRDRGNLATIGRHAAIADLGWIRFSGYFAWLTWLFIHILYLVQFQNRLLVLTQWAWNYLTRNRSARLITGEPSNTSETPSQIATKNTKSNEKGMSS